MKILFVRPGPSKETIGLQHVMLVEPLELEVMAALIGEDDEAVIVDMIIEKKPITWFLKQEKPDILAVTGYITNVPEIVHYCRMAKRLNPQSVTIVGGVHVEVVPEDLEDPSIDFRIVRNATTVFPKLLEHIKGIAERPSCVFGPRERVDFSTLPPFDFYFPRPRRELTAKYRNEYFYIFHERVALLKTAFGCPYSCNFCFCRFITDDLYHQRDMKEVLDELESIEETEIYIVDDDFLVSRKRLIEFMDGLKERNIDKHYLIYARSDFIVKNTDLVERFTEQGLKTVIVGFESFNEEELASYNKQNDVKTNEDAMAIINRLELDCYATVIIPPHWDNEDFDRLGDKLKELKVKYVNLQPLTPIPGTGFTVDEKTLVIHRSDYAKWDLAHISIRPEKMTIPEFYMNIIKLYQKLVFRPSILLSHLKYPKRMLYKMAKGSYMVHRQYMEKYREALKDA